MARAGTTYPFAIEVSGRFAGQLTVNNIVRGSAQFASMGYWIDRDFAGRGVMPRAVAMAIDHCFFTAGLHRVEIAIRPENSNSLRVVEKLEHPRGRVRARGSCTSTAPGATTGSTRSPWRSARRACWPACRVRPPRVQHQSHELFCDTPVDIRPGVR